ncbi:MAG: periplasmic heavy metal sensor [Gammaproteobacteria bacterium]|nr:periplasmic heavy metal sensor [Gammaproteobacteria bacterium]
MNKLRLCAAVIAFAMPAFTAFAEDAHHPGKEGATPAAGITTDGDMNNRPERLQEQMRKMQAQMQKIHETKQPKERQKLLQEHMQGMREAMKMMRGMRGPMMQGGASQTGGIGPGMMMGGGGMMGGGMMDMMMGGMGGRGSMGMMDMMGGGMGMMGRDGMGPFGMLNLSDEQRAKFRKIEDEQRKKTWGLMGKMMDESAKLRELYDADAPDANKIGAVYDRIFDLKREAIVVGIEARNKARAALTREQQEQIKQRRRGGMGMTGGGMMDDDDEGQRMEMMEEMMEQMLEHQEAAQGK